MRKLMKCCLIFSICSFFIATILLFIVSGPIQKYQSFAKRTIENSNASDFQKHNTGHIYDENGKVLFTLSDGNGIGKYLSYDQIPKNCIHAFVAVEDRSFYTNDGYDVKGMIRVIYQYICSKGKEIAGASTITQQLVRLQFLSPEKTFDRKLKEIYCAKEMNNKYSKKQIMEFYVNNCYFANGMYGIEAAAKYYFGKKAEELSLSQTAYLCAIPNRPSYYDPRIDPDRALERRNKILSDMLECRYINKDQYKEAYNEIIHLRKEKKTKIYNYQTSYAVHCATEYLMKKDGFSFSYSFDSDTEYNAYQKSYKNAYAKAKRNLYRDGFEVYTTLDPVMQKSLQNSVDSVLNGYTEKNKLLQGAATVIDNETGKVTAIVGGRKQKTITYNRAFQSYRQPGSAIKPLLVYTPAFEYGYDTETMIHDAFITKNFNPSSGTLYPLRYAVEHSLNGAACSVFYDIGPNQCLSYLKKMNFHHIVPEDNTLSAALGGFTYGVSTVEMASGYTALVNNGVFHKPNCIRSIKDKNGKELWEEPKEEKIYETSAAERMVDVLKGVLTSGTAKSLSWYSNTDIPAFGKTGTTNSNKDGWFCGATPYYTISVWVGYDTPKELKSLQGSSYPAAIWKHAMLSLINEKRELLGN